MLIKFGSIVTRGSGKLGGHVYSKNRGGAYIRTNQTPSNPQTSFQQSGRAVFTTLTQGWSSLTSAQRASWVNATSSFTRTNRFGDPVELSPKGLYISLNKELVLVGESVLAEAPSPAGIKVPTELQVTFEPGEINVVTPGLIGTDLVVLKSSGKVSAGTTFVKNKMRTLRAGTLSSIDTDPTGMFSAYQSRFGVLTSGDKVFFEIYTINEAGQRSPAIKSQLLFP